MKDAYSWVLDEDGNRMLWSALYADCDMIRMELEDHVAQLETKVEHFRGMLIQSGDFDWFLDEDSGKPSEASDGTE